MPMLDSTFAPTAAGELVFHPLPSLSSAELADLLQAIRIRALRWLLRQGVIEDGAELAVVDDEFAEREPALASEQGVPELPSNVPSLTSVGVVTFYDIPP